MSDENDKKNHCDGADTCTTVAELKLRWELAQKDYEQTTQVLKEVGANVSESNILLAEQGAVLTSMVAGMAEDRDDLREDRAINERRADDMFTRLRKVEKDEAVSAATKLSGWDLIKVLGAITTVLVLMEGIKAWVN